MNIEMHSNLKSGIVEQISLILQRMLPVGVSVEVTTDELLGISANSMVVPFKQRAASGDADS